MNMVEVLSEELGEKELKIMKLEEQLKEQKNRYKNNLKEQLLNAIRGLGFPHTYEFVDDGFEIKQNDRLEWDEILTEMNENDWNEDDGYSELYIDGDEIIEIRFKECRMCDNWTCEKIYFVDGEYRCMACRVGPTMSDEEYNRREMEILASDVVNDVVDNM